jgi:REP element-mobilizing transposase RayT
MYSGSMSRLRRLVLSDRFFFLTVKLLPKRRPLDEGQFSLLAGCLSVVRSRRQFQLTAWVFLPDHWHAILFPRHPLTISDTMKSIKRARPIHSASIAARPENCGRDAFSIARCGRSKNMGKPWNIST